MNKTIRDILLVAGSFIFSAGVNAFIISGNLGEGGVTGIGLCYIMHSIYHPDY